MQISSEIFVFSKTEYSRLIPVIRKTSGTLHFELDTDAAFIPISSMWNLLDSIDSGFYDAHTNLIIFLSNNWIYSFDPIGNGKFSAELSVINSEAHNCTYIMFFHANPDDWLLIGSVF